MCKKKYKSTILILELVKIPVATFLAIIILLIPYNFHLVKMSLWFIVCTRQLRIYSKTIYHVFVVYQCRHSKYYGYLSYYCHTCQTVSFTKDAYSAKNMINSRLIFLDNSTGTLLASLLK